MLDERLIDELDEDEAFMLLCKLIGKSFGDMRSVKYDKIMLANAINNISSQLIHSRVSENATDSNMLNYCHQALAHLFVKEDVEDIDYESVAVIVSAVTDNILNGAFMYNYQED